jgi:hypothetical protein
MYVYSCTHSAGCCQAVPKLPSANILLALAAPDADALRVDAPALYLAYWPYLVHETLYALLVIALGVMLQLGEPLCLHLYTAAGGIQHWLLTLLVARWQTRNLLLRSEQRSQCGLRRQSCQTERFGCQQEAATMGA